MLSAETIQMLKRINVSANGDLTKQRTKELLKSSSQRAKREIDVLSGLKRVSLNRVSATGSISARMALAIAQTLNISPYYLTGESEEKGECDNITLDAFLTDKGYSHFAKLSAAGRKTRAKRVVGGEKAEKIQGESVDAENTCELPASTDSELPKEQPPECAFTHDDSDFLPAEHMSEEEAALLFHALFAQAKYSAKAKETLTNVLSLLVFER